MTEQFTVVMDLWPAEAVLFFFLEQLSARALLWVYINLMRDSDTGITYVKSHPLIKNLFDIKLNVNH